MDRILFKKIIVFALALLFASPAFAGEFVKYNEVRSELEPKPAAESGTITPEELRALQQSGQAHTLFDARSKNEFSREHISGAGLPYVDSYYREAELFQQKISRTAPDQKAALKMGTQSLPRDARIVTYCNKNCSISKALKRQLELLGFTDVRWLSGGIDVWREKSFPTESSASV